MSTYCGLLTSVSIAALTVIEEARNELTNRGIYRGVGDPSCNGIEVLS
jgi:hypothetical protein